MSEGGGLAYREGKLLVDPARLEQQGRGARPDWLETAVTEEFIHRVSTELFTREEITGLWQQLPVEIKKTVKEAYYHSRISEGRELPAEDAWKLGHEFLRMLVQDSHFDGRLTESAAVRSGLTGRVMNLLRRLARRLREMIGRAPREVQDRIREYEEAINRRIDGLRAGAEDGNRIRGDKQPLFASEKEQSESDGPPAGSFSAPSGKLLRSRLEEVLKRNDISVKGAEFFLHGTSSEFLRQGMKHDGARPLFTTINFDSVVDFGLRNVEKIKKGELDGVVIVLSEELVTRLESLRLLRVKSIDDMPGRFEWIFEPEAATIINREGHWIRLTPEFFK